MEPSKLVCAVMCCALVFATQAVRADDTPAVDASLSPEAGSVLRVRARVRLNQTDKTLTGRLVGFDERTLLLELREGTEPLELRRADVRGLDVSVRRRRRIKELSLIHI